MPLIMGNVSQLLSLYRYHCNNGPERFHYKKNACSFGYKRREEEVEKKGERQRKKQEERKQCWWNSPSTLSSSSATASSRFQERG
jgi:hypothetical protein